MMGKPPPHDSGMTVEPQRSTTNSPHPTLPRSTSYVLLEHEADNSSDTGPSPSLSSIRCRSRRQSWTPSTSRRRQRTRSNMSRARLQPRSVRPRTWLVLPLIAILDGVAIVTLAFLTWIHHARPRVDGTDRLTIQLLISLTLAALARDAALGILGSVKTPRRYAPIVAATSLVSILFSLGILNLVLLAQSPRHLPTPRPGHPAPKVPVLRGQQRQATALIASFSLTLALVQWALHVLVAGVVLPPDGVGALHARRWLQDLDEAPQSTTVRTKRVLVPLSPAVSAQLGVVHNAPMPPLPTSVMAEESNERTHLLSPKPQAWTVPSASEGNTQPSSPPRGSHTLNPTSPLPEPTESNLNRDAERDGAQHTDTSGQEDPSTETAGEGEESETAREDGGAEDDWDADDIVDIVPDRRAGRKMSAQRLALAYADDQDPAHWRASYMSLVPSGHSPSRFPSLSARSRFPSVRTESERWSASVPDDGPFGPDSSTTGIGSLRPHSRVRTHSAVPAIAVPREEGLSDLDR